MFTDFAFSTIESDSHRRALLADAEQHRLASVARAGQRAARRATDLALQRLVESRSTTPTQPSATAPPGADCGTRAA
jgi:hypothetical protein